MPPVFRTFPAIFRFISDAILAILGLFALSAVSLNLYDRTKSGLVTCIITALIVCGLLYLISKRRRTAKAAGIQAKPRIWWSIARYFLWIGVLFVLFVAGGLVFYSSRYRQCQEKTFFFQESFKVGDSIEAFDMPEMASPFEKLVVSISAGNKVIMGSRPSHDKKIDREDIVLGLRKTYDNTREGSELGVIVMVYPARGAFSVFYSPDGKVTSVSKPRFYAD